MCVVPLLPSLVFVFPSFFFPSSLLLFFSFSLPSFFFSLLLFLHLFLSSDNIFSCYFLFSLSSPYYFSSLFSPYYFLCLVFSSLFFSLLSLLSSLLQIVSPASTYRVALISENGSRILLENLDKRAKIETIITTFSEVLTCLNEFSSGSSPQLLAFTCVT